MSQPTDLPAVLRRAAEIIKTNGHCKGTFHERGAYCAVGALRAAVGGSPYESPFYAGASELANDATAFLSMRVCSDVVDADPVERVADWNDCAERTAAEVVAELERAAADAEAVSA